MWKEEPAAQLLLSVVSVFTARSVLCALLQRAELLSPNLHCLRCMGIILESLLGWFILLWLRNWGTSNIASEVKAQCRFQHRCSHVSGSCLSFVQFIFLQPKF